MRAPACESSENETILLVFVVPQQFSQHRLAAKPEELRDLVMLGLFIGDWLDAFGCELVDRDGNRGPASGTAKAGNATRASKK
jgi:hypothetical protein